MSGDLTKSIFKIAGTLGLHPEDLVDMALNHPAVKGYTDRTVGDYLKQGIRQLGSGCNCNQGGGSAQTFGANPTKYHAPRTFGSGVPPATGVASYADTKLRPTTDAMGRHLQGAGFMKDAGSFIKKHAGKIAAGTTALAAAGLAHSIPRADSHRRDDSWMTDKSVLTARDEAGRMGGFFSGSKRGKLGDVASKSGDLASGAQGFLGLAEQLRRQQEGRGQVGRGFTENVQTISHEAVRHVLKAIKKHAPSEKSLRDALKSAIPVGKSALELAKQMGVKPSDVAKVLGQEKIGNILSMTGNGAAVGNEAMGGLGFKEDAASFFKKHGGKLAAGIATIAAATAGSKLVGSPSAPVRDNAWMTDTSHITARDAAAQLDKGAFKGNLFGRGQGGKGGWDDFWTGFKMPFKYASMPVSLAGIATGNPVLGAAGAAFGAIGGSGACRCGRQGGSGLFGDIGDWVSGAANDVGDVLSDTGKFIVNAPERAAGAFATGLTLGAYRNADTKDMGWLPFGSEGFVEKNTGIKASTALAKGLDYAGYAPVGKVVAAAGKIAGTGTIGTAHPYSNINEDATSSTNWTGVMINRGHPAGRADGSMAGNGSASGASGTSWITANSGYSATSRGSAVF